MSHQSVATGKHMHEGELSFGARCEGYRIIGLIAAGGTGDVYEAVHENSGRTVALKCLKVRHRFRDDARARMKMEAVVLSELQHANLVQVYDAGVTQDGTIWIAMERLNGETLRELLYRVGPLPILRTLYYGCEIADGVDAVHAVGVIHRDLKPENIFITDRDEVKVLDLGTGKFTGYGLNSTDRMRVVGTTAYMSPEQIKGLRVDPRADVYALGLIVYEMLTGRHALLSTNNMGALPDDIERVALMQLQLEPVPLSDAMPDLPVYVSSVVARAIAKNRDQRFANMSEFARELRASSKRYVAENRLDEAVAGWPTPIEDVRRKLGAQLPQRTPLENRDSRPLERGTFEGPVPYRPSARKSDRALEPVRRESVLVPDDGIPTEVESRPPIFTSVRTLPPPVSTQSTEVISLSSPLGGFGQAGQQAASTAIPIRTTNTNPLQCAALVPAVSRQGYRVQPASPPLRMLLTSGPVLRHIGITVALGALLGVPPALLGVWWTARHQPALSSVVDSGASGADSEGSSVLNRPGSSQQVEATSPNLETVRGQIDSGTQAGAQ
jgi:serine/threonine protein kinase